MIKKSIIAMAAFAALAIGNSVTLADNSNDLLRMDIKKSGATDTVDVTFYTTGGATDSVVTRKSDNRYVVLLPNVAGSQSVAPSLGGVKDLVTDVSVKNVDDGIGGYTKVTFSTTKPVKFQTRTQKTAPLTQAQQEYKNLIAANSKFDVDNKTQNFKGSNNNASTAKTTQNTTTKPVINTTKAQVSTPAKTTNSANVKNTQATKTLAPKVSNTPSVTKNTTQTQKTVSTKQNPPKQNIKTTATVQKTETVKPIKPTPIVVNNNVTTKAPEKIEKPATNANSLNNKSAENSAAVKTSEKKVNTQSTQDKKGLPIFPIAGAISALGILLLVGIIGRISRSVSKNSTKWREAFDASEINQSQKRGKAYKNIMNDSSLSWQERYKQYTEKEKEFNKDTNSANDYSYVTNMGATKSSITKDGVKNSQLHATISQMEHSLSQTPSLDLNTKEKSNDVVTDENSITNKIDNVKLKSFAKNMSLREANRSILRTSVPKELTHDAKKESRFVKLRNSALSVSRRNSLSSKVNISDLARSNNIYDKQSKETIISNSENNVLKTGLKPVKKSQVTIPFDAQPITKQKYSTSSINEYLDIVGNENGAPSIEILSRPMSSMRRSSMSNELSPLTSVRQKNEDSNKVSLEKEKGNLEIRNKYSIDNNKSIYLVDLDGQTSVVAEVNDEITVIKKFDKIINKPLQVRPDYGNVYIVRVGGFKCLVDVSDKKVGTLLEI